MYPIRIARCPSHGARGMRHGPGASRALASFLPGPYWRQSHRSPPFAGEAFAEWNPWVRAFDEQMTRTFDSIFPNAQQSGGEASGHRRHNATFEPRFDVKETEKAYELRGEIPGVAPSNLHVEFADHNTLVISGSTESEVTKGTPPAAINAGNTGEQQSVQAATEHDSTATPADTADTASVHSHDSTSSYVKPSVEDEDATNQDSTPAEKPTEAAPADTPAQQTQQEPQPTYWMHERTTGSFKRNFRFSAPVDIDSVSANLKNGILEVVVPKVVIEKKQITVN